MVIKAYISRLSGNREVRMHSSLSARSKTVEIIACFVEDCCWL